MEINLVSEAIKFMFLGMGIVFLFLVVMIYVLKLQGFLVQKFFPQQETKVSTTVQAKKPTANTTKDDANVVAAISAAIQHHKQH